MVLCLLRNLYLNMGWCWLDLLKLPSSVCLHSLRVLTQVCVNVSRFHPNISMQICKPLQNLTFSHSIPEGEREREKKVHFANKLCQHLRIKNCKHPFDYQTHIERENIVKRLTMIQGDLNSRTERSRTRQKKDLSMKLPNKKLVMAFKWSSFSQGRLRGSVAWGMKSPQLQSVYCTLQMKAGTFN